MNGPPSQPIRHAENAVECWDDDGDIQGVEDLAFRNISSTTVGSMQHRESISSRLSLRSDRDSVGANDEDWQVLLPEDDEKTTSDAISSAKSAGIPIPQNVPISALLGGTIKRLGGRRLKKALGDDWGDDIEMPHPQAGNLVLKQRDGADAFDDFGGDGSLSPSSNKDSRSSTFLDRLTAVTQTTSGKTVLEKFRDEDEDDAFFGDAPTIRVAKNRMKSAIIPKVPLECENMEEDLELPNNGEPLRLSSQNRTPKTPSSNINDESDLDWAEGSLGTRIGGTRRDLRSNPSSSITFSPSASSCLTAESEDDGLDGLILPDSDFKFGEALQKRMDPVAGISPTQNNHLQQNIPERGATSEKDDFFSELDIGQGDVFDTGKLTLNRNIKHKAPKAKSPVRRPATTITFTNKTEPSASKIPRPQSHDRPRSTLESVSESGPAPQYRRPGSVLGGHSSQSSYSNIPLPAVQSPLLAAPSTPSRRVINRQPSRDGLRAEIAAHTSNYLKSKRSMPVITRNQPSPARQPAYQRPPSRGADRSESSLSNIRKPAVPFLPAGSGSAQSHHIMNKASKNTHRPGSSDSGDVVPTNRPLSRLSHLFRPSTPNNRRDLAPEALVREAAAKRTITKPMRRRVFGDGNELDIFDDLPTSASAESKFTKQPIGRGAPISLQARSRLGLHVNISSTSIGESRASTPAGPLSPAKQEHLPRFARDTNASRLAREQRIGSVSAALHNSSLQTVRETGGPLASLSTNLKAPQHFAGKPLASPFAHSKRRPKAPPQKPRLIKPLGGLHNHPKEEKGMHWNPALFRWEGNENILAPFDIPTMPSGTHGLASPNTAEYTTGKPAPALIANVGASKTVQMSGGMVFDPQRMCWLKAAPASDIRNTSRSFTSGSFEEEDDPFAGFEDLTDAPMSVAGRESRNVGGLDDLRHAASMSHADGNMTIGLNDVEPLVISEEFDVGPEFVRRLRVEEERWKNKVGDWVGTSVMRDDGSNRWKWAIRTKAMGF